MALDTAPKLTRKRALAFALETTNGTPATVAAADVVTAFFSPDFKAETEKVERESFQGLSPIVQAFGARKVTVTFETELVGSGSSGAPIWTRLLQCCGYSASGGIWSPVDGATQTCTIKYFQDGLARIASGCMGNVAFTLRRGQKGRAKWTMTGVRQPCVDLAIITPTYITTVAPRIGASVFTVGGTAYRIPEVVIDTGNTVILREDISALDSASVPTGYRCAYITGRTPTVKMSAESVSVATKDWRGLMDASTRMALVSTFGLTAGNTFSFGAPNMQIVDDPNIEDRQGMQSDVLDFICTSSVPGTPDELALTLS